ncbi:MAG: VOC family protein [Thermoanaerobaculia bacterium]|nr:VOC family protein [Thermoanaerobaculia bacterium]
MPNPFCYTELHTQKPQETGAFYSKLLDWKLTTSDTPMGPYTMIDTQSSHSGGVLVTENGGSQWVPYIQVDSLETSTDRAKELGAEAIKELVPVPGMGRFSLLVDPGGATFGLWQQDS